MYWRAIKIPKKKEACTRRLEELPYPWWQYIMYIEEEVAATEEVAAKGNTEIGEEQIGEQE